MCKSGGPDQTLAKRCASNGFMTAREVLAEAKKHCENYIGQQDDHHKTKMDLETNNGLEFRLFNWKSGDSGPFISGLIIGVVICVVVYVLYMKVRGDSKKRDARLLNAVAPRGNDIALTAIPAATAAIRSDIASGEISHEIAALRRSIRRQQLRAAHDRDAHRFQPIAEGERYVA